MRPIFQTPEGIEWLRRIGFRAGKSLLHCFHCGSEEHLRAACPEAKHERKKKKKRNDQHQKSLTSSTSATNSKRLKRGREPLVQPRVFHISDSSSTQRATAAICWPFLLGKECSRKSCTPLSRKLHLDHCPAAIASLLNQRGKACSGKCGRSHAITLPVLQAAILDWFGSDWRWCSASQLRAHLDAERLEKERRKRAKRSKQMPSRGGIHAQTSVGEIPRDLVGPAAAVGSQTSVAYWMAKVIGN